MNDGWSFGKRVARSLNTIATIMPGLGRCEREGHCSELLLYGARTGSKSQHLYRDAQRSVIWGD